MTDQAPRWPDAKRACVALAFDLDGPTGDAMLNGSIWRNPAYFTLGSYGPWRALGRLLDMLASFALPATFFVPAWVARTWPAQCAAIVERGHEIGYHGYRHEAFWTLEPDRQREIMAQSADIFARTLGVRPVGFRTPSGDWSAATVAVLREAGVRYSSSMRGDDRPYLLHGENGEPPLVEIPGRWETDDYASLAYHRNPDYPAGLDRIAGYGATLDNWTREFDGVYREGLCLTTLLHPKVCGKPGRIALLEAWLDHMCAQDGVWFARCRDVADWWLAQAARDAAPTQRSGT
ncbi:polysaccharide deacetylase [Burkholderia sp. AU42008]|uniref:polysaccharide deacetylase family protein n=1 Tax=unclassified Burkholderia TaxID=2613784 RepID=UPI000B79F0D4|nr:MULTISPECIES: polysaccharide deacetylase [unclassified Burkholderia]MBR8235902.1 polysaccharide deacetylase [Burkholderia sp. AU32357]MBY4871914.1 polysaccharide deacetylase [Burkholderia sp. AU42008]OXI37987.1 polysaccharide deacetylase [Burkholderia sp. AU17457]OXI64785.1 polysaccharide deacetylase [Burkholderia sp. AU28863]